MSFLSERVVLRFGLLYFLFRLFQLTLISMIIILICAHCLSLLYKHFPIIHFGYFSRTLIFYFVLGERHFE